ncbi:MAG: pentapeptide repeat-containing protein [Acidimicrobiia bacterium]|nr:pentapeptide repeat-containing protein [Acidimicrobiia bacterium]MCL4293668.1 pentapeptide repeat-containing protein [Acidimicrobiia bacterium]
MERRGLALVAGAMLIVVLALLAAGCGTEGGSRAAGVEVGECEVRAGARCAGMNLAGGNFLGVDLSGADLRRADLRNAIFRDADLRRADLRRADLRRADLSRADLRGARLDGARLEGALMTNATVDGTKQYAAARVCNLTLPDGSVTRRGCPKETPETAPANMPIANPSGYLTLGRASCNTPVGSSIEVRVGAAMVTRVELQLDGVLVRSMLALVWLPDTPLNLPYPCDGKRHTYTMVALAPGLYPFVVSQQGPAV